MFPQPDESLALTYPLVCLVTVELKSTGREYSDAVNAIAFEVAFNAFFRSNLLQRLYNTRVHGRLALCLKDNLEALKRRYYGT